MEEVGQKLNTVHLVVAGSERSSKSPSSKARPLFTLYFHQTCLPLTKTMNHPKPPPPPRPSAPLPETLFIRVVDRLISTVAEVRGAMGSLGSQTHTANTKMPQQI